MSSPPSVAVTGCARRTGEAITDQSLEELVFATASATAADAGMHLTEVDSVVVSGNDQTDGRIISAMVGSGPSAGVGRDLTTIASAAEHALLHGWMRLLAGQDETVLVLGWGKPSEGAAPEHAQLVSAEPFLLRPVGMNDPVAAALQASRLEPDATPTGRTVAWPLGEDDLRPEGDGVYGLLLAAGERARLATAPAWIRGGGWAMDRYELGDRSDAGLGPLRAALASADLDRAPDLLEVGAPSATAVRAIARTVEVAADDVNRSGALHEVAAPTHAAGLMRMSAAAEHVRDAAREGRALRTAGVATSGFAGQGASVVVFDTEEER